MNKTERSIIENLFYNSHRSYCLFADDIKESHLQANIQMIKDLKVEIDIKKCKEFICNDTLNYISNKFDLESFRIANLITKNDYKLRSDLKNNFTTINKLVETNFYLYDNYLIDEYVFNYNADWLFKFEEEEN